ncbi:hypothetical protein ACWCXE_02300 [Streptomyces sp. NPDC001780]
MAHHPTPAWFDSLTASVHALGAAAREYRTANKAAHVASWSTEPTRLLPVNGGVRVPGRDIVRPQHDALWRLRELYGELEAKTKRLYENTAQAYAHGTTSAVLSVLDGERPPYVELGRRDDGYVLPAEPLPDLSGVLARWPGNERLAVLAERVNERRRAWLLANEYASFEDLVVHETGEIADANERAAGLADSAYAYGEAAESALHFLILTDGTGRAAKGDR